VPYFIVLCLGHRKRQKMLTVASMEPICPTNGQDLEDLANRSGVEASGLAGRCTRYCAPRLAISFGQ